MRVRVLRTKVTSHTSLARLSSPKLKRIFRASSWYQQQARHESRPFVFEGEARVACHQQRWRTRHDSNVWPPPSEGGALSSCATGASLIRVARSTFDGQRIRRS